MAQLLIQNKGEAPVEAFTLLGASLSRSDDGLIGQFGSGAKLAITTLLRLGRKVTVYCGLTRMEFKTKTILINDGIEEQQKQQVYVQFGGTSKRKLDLGWVLDFGAIDWKDVDMAYREFVSNAIDRTIKSGDTVADAHTNCDLIVDIVDDDTQRAQAGFTRVYVEADDKCQEYVDDLRHKFLQFSAGYNPTKRILPKLGDRRKAQIYYNGVFVRELGGHPDSFADYNFTGNQITIDESRNLDEYSVRAAIARLYRDASHDNVVKFLRAVDRGEDCLETKLDSHYLKPNTWSDSEQQKKTWQEAWETVHGDKVACSQNDGVVGEIARRKGFQLGVVAEPSMMEVIKSFDIPTTDTVLDGAERQGRVVTAPTFEAIDAVKLVWSWVETAELLDPEKCPMPKIKGFNEITDAESECLGFVKPGGDTVYLRNDLGGDMLLEAALEEVSHYVTGSTDCSRDFQNFLMRLLIRLMKCTSRAKLSSSSRWLTTS
jgi:hypothetical protein